MSDFSATSGAGRPGAFNGGQLAWLSRWGWLGIWLALLLAPLALRGPLPPDEVRYLSVAWEMWSSGNWLVPHLGGAPYSDKPPVLFWLMHAGWAVFGVNDWWPRALPALLALSSILLTRRLCRLLWPEHPEAAQLVPWVLLGSFAWTIYTQVILFDLLLANWVLLGLLGLVQVERGDLGGWRVLAAATALGLLTKGPVMLLHLAGPVLLIRWWGSPQRAAVPRRYRTIALAVAAGCGIALAWAISASLVGGSQYGSELLLRQTAGRLVESFAHQRSYWYYVWMLPILIAPWSIWPAVWRAVRAGIRESVADHGARFVFAATVPAVVAFTFISGKQPHYLLPQLPLLTAWLAVLLASRTSELARTSALLPAIAVALVAIASAYFPRMVSEEALVINAWSPAWGIGASVLILALGYPGYWTSVVRRQALAIAVMVIAAEVAFFQTNRSEYDLQPAATMARELEQSGYALAFAGAYNGELHFLGRLSMPIDEIRNSDASLSEWAARHPDGYVVSKTDDKPDDVFFAQRHRGGWLIIQPVGRRDDMQASAGGSVASPSN